MFRRLLRSCLLTLGFASCESSAAFESMGSMVDVEAKMRDQLQGYSPDDILLCLDVDLTLTVTSELAAQWPTIKKYKAVFKEILRELAPLEVYTLLNLSTKTQPPMLIEEETPRIVSEWIQKGLKVIALTDATVGQVGDIKDALTWRIRALEALGISFQSSFPAHEHLSFGPLTQKTGRHPQFSHGVLFADSGGRKDLNKGIVLVAFLRKVGIKPKVVILVDDRVKQLEAVKKGLEAFNPSIHFIGIEYTGGHAFSSGYLSEDQFRTFWKDLAIKAKEEVRTSETSRL